jgi:hypothetical protein
MSDKTPLNPLLLIILNIAREIIMYLTIAKLCTAGDIIDRGLNINKICINLLTP